MYKQISGALLCQANPLSVWNDFDNALLAKTLFDLVLHLLLRPTKVAQPHQKPLRFGSTGPEQAIGTCATKRCWWSSHKIPIYFRSFLLVSIVCFFPSRESWFDYRIFHHSFLPCETNPASLRYPPSCATAPRPKLPGYAGPGGFVKDLVVLRRISTVDSVWLCATELAGFLVGRGRALFNELCQLYSQNVEPYWQLIYCTSNQVNFIKDPMWNNVKLNHCALLLATAATRWQPAPGPASALRMACLRLRRFLTARCSSQPMSDKARRKAAATGRCHQTPWSC